MLCTNKPRYQQVQAFDSEFSPCPLGFFVHRTKKRPDDQVIKGVHLHKATQIKRRLPLDVG